MSENEKIHLSILMKEIMSDELKIFKTRNKLMMWFIGGTMFVMLTVYLGIAGPISAKVSRLDRENADQINSDIVIENFLSKQQYHQLQKDEHEVDVQAINDPKNANWLYLEHNNKEKDRLNIRFRGAN